MDTVTLGVLVAVLVVILAALMYAKQAGSEESKTRQRRNVPQPGQAAPEGVRGPGGRRGGARMRRPAAPSNSPSNNQQGGDGLDDDNSGDDDEGGPIDAPSGKIGKKKLEKLQAKADKKVAREAEERQREERKKQKEKEDEEARKAAEQDKLEEEREEELERKRLEEKERREQEEYEKMKAAFDVEEEGFDEDQEDTSEGQLQAFIQHIKDTKVVLLEDLAAHFKMKTQDCIDRVTQLSDEGKLTGVLDDRGKFIYISEEELHSVAKFIKQRGRVSITDLAENSNKLISLKS